jgi:septal ring factor EnvC (AmiA/AmiB activator)
MKNFLGDLVLGDLISDLERFKHQMELKRASIEEVDAARHQVEEALATTKRELAVAHADLARAQAKHEELQNQIKKWTKQLENA